ncbi:glycoside hydrolase family 30 beta sandwich domain-containing protein [Bacteroides rodentium]
MVPGSRILVYQAKNENNTPVLVARTPQNKYVVIAGNFNEEAKELTLKLDNRYLNITLQPHSFNTFQMN